MGPIRIQAQALRRHQTRAFGAFSIMPEDAVDFSAGGDKPTKEGWRQADVKRAIAAAEQAGLDSYRVTIAPDGSISIIVGDPADTADPEE